MNLLKAALYDPAGAVSKATSALLAMTAFDTVNLRLAITVPAHGMVRFKGRVAVVGATTPPVLLLGVMNGATVIARVVPQYTPVTAPAATQIFLADFECTVTGLAAGAMNVDLAYAVQVVVAATNIKYGGPNTNAGANAWGAAVFEAWDPQPQTANSTLAVDANGRVDVSKALGQAVTLDANNVLNVSTKYVGGTLQTAGDIPAKTNALTFTGANKVDASVRDWVGDAIPARNVAGVPLVDMKYVLGTISPAAAGSVRADAVTGTVGSVTGNVGGSVASVTARVTANIDQVDGAALTAHAAGKLPADVLTVAGTVQTARDLGAQLDAAVSTRAAIADYSAARAAKLDNLDATVSSRVAAANITLTGGKVDVNDKTGFALTAAYDGARTAAQAVDYTAARAAKLDNLDATVSSRLATAGYTAPLSAAGVRGALGMAAANLDAQLDALPTAAEIRVEMDANSADLDTILAGTTAIYARTDVATSSRLATAGYTAPDNAGIASAKAVTDKLDTMLELDVLVWRYTVNALELAPLGLGGGGGLDAAGVRAALGMAAANLDTQIGNLQTSATAIKGKTDSLNFTVAGKLDVNVLHFNSVQVIGTGADGDRWRSA